MKLGPAVSFCAMDGQLIAFNIVIKTTFTRDQLTVVDPIHWDVVCDEGTCAGTATRVLSQNENRIESYPVNARVVSQIGLTAIVEWLQNVLVIDALRGTVTFTGSLSNYGWDGHGKALCDEYSPTYPGKPVIKSDGEGLRS